jgi:DNA-directed RNA polymerase subunit RPC12/RpoP
MQIPTAIDCPDCGGKASLLSFLPEDEEVAPGTPIAYRCADCLERFDVVVGEDDEDGEPD